jgi:type VI secretion system secreted protein Hcp
MAIYLEFEGIKGNVTADGYKGHIALNAVNFGVLRSIKMEPGNMSNREATRPEMSQITLTKAADSSATALFKEAVTGSTGKRAVIKFVQTGVDKVQEFMSYTLENCLISGYAIDAKAENHPKEVLTLSFSKILVNYSNFDASNKSTSPQRVGYDLVSAKPL